MLGRVDRGGYARAGVAAAAAMVGELIAALIGALLFVVLFNHVGTSIAEDVAADASKGQSGANAVLGGLFGGIAGALVGTLAVVLLVISVMALLVLGCTAIGLRLIKAALIARTVWLTLLCWLVLGLGIGNVLSAVGVHLGGWYLLVIVPCGAFCARLLVEFSWPSQAAPR
ncbi:MAG: hypothetical protein J2O49_00980 [Sciscionella sp.]|nr:hypothetical protein [Sciscionella sp.]